MQFIITMAGLGQRFKKSKNNSSGINIENLHDNLPKPFIVVAGKSILQHLTDALPKNAEYYFAIGRHLLDDLSEEFINSEIQKLAKKNHQIIYIDFSERGPIDTVLQTLPFVNPALPTCVSYCDYTMKWDFKIFFYSIVKSQAQAAIVSYTGFHPTFLGPNSYCHLRVKEDLAQQNFYNPNTDFSYSWVTDIQEKKLFTGKLENEWTSCGLYYFKSADFLSQCLQAQLDQNLCHQSGEYYTSLAIKAMMLKDQSLRVLNFPISHIVQMGTPFDVQRFQFWYDYFILKKEQTTPGISFTKQEEKYWREYFSS